MRGFWLFTHRWLGLSVGLILSFIGLSGSALVFRTELDARLNPSLLHVEPLPSKVSWQSTYIAVRSAFPTAEINFVSVGKTSDAPLEFWLDDGQQRVYVDPYLGTILGRRTATSGFFPWLYEAHTHLFAGETGERISGWCGLVLASLSLSGLILWWPRRMRPANWRHAFRLHWKTNTAGKIYESHRWSGFWLSGFLLMSSLTGVALAWPEPATHVMNFLLRSEAAKSKKPSQAAPQTTQGKSLSLDELVRRADVAFPEGRLTRISFPTKSGAPVVIRKRLESELHPNGLNNIALAPSTGQILSRNDVREATLAQRAMNLRYPLHIGLWGGKHLSAFSRIIQVFIGLAPALFFITGLLIWWRKKRAKKRIHSATP
jgi:uncharacterized iron-regulated membrane protein